ncbi:MAG: hypothetical protein KKD69_02530 [Euryarchaeota archaeon]|nr:hypothetical protein [Euryarchaeota archaeon]
MKASASGDSSFRISCLIAVVIKISLKTVLSRHSLPILARAISVDEVNYYRAKAQ